MRQDNIDFPKLRYTKIILHGKINNSTMRCHIYFSGTHITVTKHILFKINFNGFTLQGFMIHTFLTDPFLTPLTCKMIHDIITLFYLRSPDTVTTITITSITFSILQISKLAHRVGDQLSAGIINGREPRKLEPINIANDQGTTLVLITLFF